ncbi:MAG: proton-conducting transporter membrane subunit [Nitrososphaerota archaeon]|nr:hypothetical protein [Nitrososphaerales archaeon]MDW8044501.1 proton-conducting transporter membrane subunit [Nitrososphaerota archaeon]
MIFPPVGLAVITPIVLAFITPLLSIIVKSRRILQTYTAAATFIILVITSIVFLNSYIVTPNKPLLYLFGGWPAPVGIVYEVDRFNALIGLLISSIMFLIALYSLKYLEHDDGVEWYCTLLLGIEAGMLGCVYTGDAFNLFVMIEVMSVSSYGLVAFRKRIAESVEAGIKYAILGAMATTFYFIALVFLYASMNTLNMADVAAKLSGIYIPVTGAPQAGWKFGIVLFIIFMLWAFTFKSAVFPNHFWLPDAHSLAPSSISALLSGLYVSVGVYLITRFLFTVLRSTSMIPVLSIVLTALFTLGIVSAFFASFLMTVQDDVKRIIAYSTILNIGYMMMGLGLGTFLGLKAAIYHLVSHAVTKALLFLAVGVFIHYAGSRMMIDLAGIGRRFPVTSLCFFIGAIALAGVPPLNGFIGKLYLYYALLEVGYAPFVIAIVVPSVVAFLAYLRMVYGIWFSPPKRSFEVEGEHPCFTIPIIILTVATVLLGVLSPLFMEHVISHAVDSLLDQNSYVKPIIEIYEALIKR